jgi:hypothetical protein
LPGGGIQPLRVINQAQQRPLFGNRGHQTEHGHADQERVGDIPGRQPDRNAQRVALRLRKGVDPSEHRRAELMNPRERELHLGFDARDLRDTEPRCLSSGVAQQCGLADAGVATNHQHSALTAAHIPQ